MLTVNQIIAQVQALANAHYQIAEVGVGTIDELQAKERSYPLLWVSHEAGSLQDNYKINNIRLTIFDRVITGQEGQDDSFMEQEVLSDTELILLDFLNYFHQNHTQEYVTTKTAPLEHFTERTNDRTAGWSTVLELRQFYDWNKCSIPESGATIDPTVDGLTLYDFCDSSVINRLTAAQVACIQSEFCGVPDPVTIQLNGVTYTTAASGTTFNQVVENAGGVSVGTSANPSVVANSVINFNGSDVDQVKAEDTFPFFVKLDGVNSGTYDAPTKTVNVSSATPSLAVTFYSDAGLTNPITDADFGDTVYINAVATNITPTSYRFFVKDSIDYVLTEQASATLSKTISTFTDLSVYVEAIDATNATCEREESTLTINSDADATAFIAAHNAISGTTMGSTQQTAVETFFLNLKGFGTTNGSDIWSIANGNANSRIFPLVPIDDSTTSFAVYQLDAVHLSTGTYNNFVLGDLSVNGVTGGTGKYFDAGVSPNDLPQNDVSTHYYSRTNIEGNYRDVGASDAASFSTKQFSITANRSGQYRIDLNATGTLTNIVGASDTRGTYSGVRSASNLTTLYKDGSSVGTSSVASVTPTTSNLYFHSHNQGGTLFQTSVRQLSFYAIMPSLNANEIADLEEAIVNLQTNVITGGRNV